MWKQVGSYSDDTVDAPVPKPAGNPINLNPENGQILPRKRTSPQLRVIEVSETNPVDTIVSRIPSKSHYHY